MPEATTRVVVAGATGLVGRECVRTMLAAGGFEVVALARRPDAFAATAGLRVAVVDYARLEPGPLVGADAILCALGTTLRTAGSQAAFRRVDHDHVVAVARLGRECGVRHFGLVSALGADARSRVFYNRVKGEVEGAVTALGYPSLAIVRPSLLLGDRAEFRPGEVLGRIVGVVAPPAWRPVGVPLVAAALVRRAVLRRPGVEVVENASLRREPAVTERRDTGS